MKSGQNCSASILSEYLIVDKTLFLIMLKILHAYVEDSACMLRQLLNNALAVQF